MWIKKIKKKILGEKDEMGLKKEDIGGEGRDED